MPKILLVEDDVKLCTILEDHLKHAKYAVEVANSGPDGFERLQLSQYDLVILDVELPGMSGFEVCKQYREKGGQARVIMLTGLVDSSSKIAGLDCGADDYLTKPFDVNELDARLRALLRRPQAVTHTVLKAGDLELDCQSYVVTRSGEPIALFKQEIRLLEFFLRHTNEVFSAEAILQRVWATDADVSPDTVRVHITRLRNKIDTPGKPSRITTVPRLGYRFEAE